MEPVTIAMLISAALSAAATYSQSKANDKQRERQQALTLEEAARRRQTDDERRAAITEASQKFTPQAQTADQESIAAKLSEALTPKELPQGGGDATYGVNTNPGAPTEIADNKARALSDALGKGQDYARRLAKVSAFGEQGFGNSLALGRLGESIGQMNNNQQMSGSVLDAELQGAMGAGGKYSGMADLFNGGSSIAGAYGMSQMGKPAAGGTMYGVKPVEVADYGALGGGFKTTSPGWGLKASNSIGLKY